MLLSLSIRDIVLIDRLDLEWSEGLCTLTGETGAGKSILLDALALAIGARGDAGLVRRGAEQGSVSAVFDMTGADALNERLVEAGVSAGMDGDASSELILRRIQTPDGRSRAFINDAPVSVALLREIGGQLVEIHGQNESQSLTDAGTQLDMLDKYAGLMGLRREIFAAFEARKRAQDSLNAHVEATKASLVEADFLRHAVAELTEFTPLEDEEDKLSEQRSLLQNATKLSGDLNTAMLALEGDNGAEKALSQAMKALQRASAKAGSLLDEVMQIIERAQSEASEATSSLGDVARRLKADPYQLEKIEDRLFGLRDLARKHNVPAVHLPRHFKELQERLEAIDNDPEIVKKLEQDYQRAQALYQTHAEQLSKARADAASKLDAGVNSELVPLKLDGAKFETEITVVPVEQGSATGMDRIRFVAQTNPGTPSGPIAKIASGGELARFMLALKLVLSAGQNGQTMIFDEVDAGVGGAVAEAVGDRLHRLAQGNQLLVVTHSPQVAACGDHHWKVHKSSDTGLTASSVTLLEAEPRLEEVARMLSGAEVTDEARAAARRLLAAPA
ncbi:DNA repair protein RecN [Alphaproteobacteria bacterium]|nr:DNA repair protein RecN [Alphaproteobacteria bacterium]